MNDRTRERWRWQRLQTRLPPNGRPAAPSISRCASCRARSARPCSQIYSFCRQVDDIADSSGPRDAAPRAAGALARRHRRALRRQPAARTPGLAAPVRDFGLRREDFHAVIDGMEMDIVADIRAPDGRRSTSIATGWRARSDGFRSACSEWPNATAWRSRTISGRALQLTNILRDLDEDAAIGRLYLPARGFARGRHSRHRAGRRYWRARRLALVCTAWSSARARISRRPPPSWRAARAAPCAHPASWRRPIESFSTAWSIADGRIRAARSSFRALRLLWLILRHAFI